jgi:hypothetical protein
MSSMPQQIDVDAQDCPEALPAHLMRALLQIPDSLRPARHDARSTN